MYYHLVEATKRRFIAELRRYWSYHPRYRDIVDNIQGKYAFKERPQYGIVLKSASANQVQLSADNFLATVQSYIYLAKYENKPGLAVEWITEDIRAINENGGAFPSPPGVYYIEILETDEPVPAFNRERTFDFMVDPLLVVKNETAVKVDDFTWQVQRPYLDGTTQVFEMPGGVEYVRDVNYTEDPTTGDLLLTTPLSSGRYLSVDYHYAAESTGPWRIKENFSHKTAIPGCTLVFGRRVEAGDILAVVVQSRRQPAALEYGGRWDVSLDFDVVARDVDSQQEISDATVMYLWGVARNRLSTEGIEITNVSMGGESEEIYDETAEDMFYNGSFSVQVQVDWSVRVPLAATIRHVTPQTAAQVESVAGMTDDELLAATDAAEVQQYTVVDSMGLIRIEDPFFSGKLTSFERIS